MELGCGECREIIRHSVQLLTESPSSLTCYFCFDLFGHSAQDMLAPNPLAKIVLALRLSAMLDVSEGGLDAGGVEPGSPSSYARSRSRNLLPPSPNAGGGQARGTYKPAGSSFVCICWGHQN